MAMKLVSGKGPTVDDLLKGSRTHLKRPGGPVAKGKTEKQRRKYWRHQKRIIHFLAEQL
jgi:hypothetical protein